MKRYENNFYSNNGQAHMDQKIYNIWGLVLHVLYIFLPLILGGITLLLKHVKAAAAKVEIFFVYFLIISVGVQGLLTGCLQIFVAESVVNLAKWPFSPFLMEVGFANLVFGILGIASIWIKDRWRDATAIGYSLFLIAIAINLIVNISQKGNITQIHYGPKLWSDILVPVALWILIALKHAYKKETR